MAWEGPGGEGSRGGTLTAERDGPSWPRGMGGHPRSRLRTPRPREAGTTPADRAFAHDAAARRQARRRRVRRGQSSTRTDLRGPRSERPAHRRPKAGWASQVAPRCTGPVQQDNMRRTGYCPQKLVPTAGPNRTMPPMSPRQAGRHRGLSPGPLCRGTDRSGSAPNQPAFSTISRPWKQALERMAPPEGLGQPATPSDTG